MADKPKDTPTEKPSVAHYDAAMKECAKEDAKHAHVVTKDEDGDESSLWIELPSKGGEK